MDYAKHKIAKLIVDYSNKGLIPDKAFVDEVINLIVNALNIKEYVLDRSFSAEKDLLGGYDCFSRTVYIDMDRLITHVNGKLDTENNNGIINTEEERLLKYNLCFVNTIAHELYHALQYKTVFSNKNSVESELLKLSFEHNLMVFSSEINNKMLTKDEVNYITTLGDLEDEFLYLNALPSERMACIDASKVEKDIANIVNRKQKIKDYYKIKHELEKTRGYLHGNCPTAYILTAHNKLRNAFGIGNGLSESLDENEKLCINTAKLYDMSLEDRFYYGLYVKEDELNPRLDEINKLTLGLINNN